MTVQPTFVGANFHTTQAQTIYSSEEESSNGSKELKNTDRVEKSNPNDPQSYEDDPQIKQIVAKLKARDSEVRAHESAHIAAGAGVVTGGASFTYQKGPDGSLYAIGGEVPIDTSTESSPQATIQKMQKVQAAALAPADPSPTDIKVASTASMLEARAQEELRKEQEEESLMTNDNKQSNIETYKENDDSFTLSQAV